MMIKWCWAIISVAILSGCSSEQRVVISVPAIMCEESCTVATRDILLAQAGVRQVDVRFETKTATMLVDRRVFQVEQAIAALDDHGFEDSRVLD